MKFRILCVLFICATLTWAADTDFSVNIHVRESRMARDGGSLAFRQRLEVTIDGKKYELESLGFPNALLELGDYKARLSRDQRGRNKYDSWIEYELLLPDQKTRKFVLVSQSE